MNRANRWISVSLAAAGYFATLVAGHGVAAQDANRAVAEPRIRVAQQQTPPKQNTPIAQAQPAAPPPPTVPAWAVSCSDREQGKLLCEMTQNVVERTSGSQVALFSVKGTSDGGATAMLIRLFHGIYIPAGASIRIDEGSPTKAEFQKSDQLGVYAALPLSANLLTELRRGKELRVNVEINKGQPFTVTALLNGFGPAYDRVIAMK